MTDVDARLEPGALPDLVRCPCCGRGLTYRAGPDPGAGLRNYTRQVAGPERAVLYGACPWCLARWHRYPRGHPLYEAAAPLVQEWPAVGVRAWPSAWRNNRVRVLTDAGAVHLVPATSRPSGGRKWSGGAVHVLTAWNPGGRPSSLKANLAAQRRLVRRLRWSRAVVKTGATFDDDLRWAEQAVVLTDVDPATVTDLARRFDQPAYLQVSDGLMAPVDRVRGEPVCPPVPVVAVPAVAGCPASSDDIAPGGVCRDPGGPWGSASMHESLRWTLRRDLLLATLGCGICHGRPPARATRGGPVAVSGQVVASRYGPGR